MTSLAVSEGRIYLLGGTCIAVIDDDNVSTAKPPGSDAELFAGGRPMTLKSSLREKLSENIGDRFAVSEKGSLTGLTDGMDPPAGKLLFLFGEEHADRLFELIDGASRGYDYLDPVMSIVLEEASAYFSGAKTVDETTVLINDRVSTFISENR